MEQKAKMQSVDQDSGPDLNGIEDDGWTPFAMSFVRVLGQVGKA